MSIITPRKAPDLGLDGDIPKHWFGGDPFKTRFFDAMSMVFPDGERYFIACVRDYRDRIADPVLAGQVSDFIYQEGQHGSVHARFNARLRMQGIAVGPLLEQIAEKFAGFRKRFSRSFNLGKTAAIEHLTAIMAHGFIAAGLLRDADPRVRAMYTWHAMEEIEHKAVAFDVFQKVARGSYVVRILSMLHTSLFFPLDVFLIMRYMLRVDGAGTWRTWARGLWWLYGPRGLYLRLLPHYLAYFLPTFHPSRFGDMAAYERWVSAYRQTGGDAVAAGSVTLISRGQKD